MDSKEFGLVAAQQLFQIEDLHYGFWDLDENKDLGSWEKAQLKHTQFLFKYINKFIDDRNTSKLLDVGCGIGITTKKLLDEGFYIDGLVPYKWMADYAKNLTQEYLKHNKTSIFECKFEDFPINTNKKYNLIFFSESYQYVNMIKSFDVIEKILSKNGKIIIFDFFKKDNIEGESPLGGGHSIGSFYNILKKYNYEITEDIDVTKNLSPNLKLVNDMIIDRLIPFSKTLDMFLHSRNKYVYKFIKWIMKKRLNKLKFQIHKII